MMLENTVYDDFEMAVEKMAQKGLFGELIHAEGGYAHPIGDRWTPWRMAYAQQNGGDIYPTHSIGPACKLLNMHKTDRMHYLTSMQTDAFIGTQIYQKVMQTPCSFFANGDQTSTTIRTLKGQNYSYPAQCDEPTPI